MRDPMRRSIHWHLSNLHVSGYLRATEIPGLGPCICRWGRVVYSAPTSWGLNSDVQSAMDSDSTRYTDGSHKSVRAPFSTPFHVY